MMFSFMQSMGKASCAIGLLGIACFVPFESVAVAGDVVVHRNVQYVEVAADPKHVADIYVPPGKGPFPGILMIHGGAWAAGAKGHMLAHSRHASESGYTVVAMNYRLAPKHPFPAQFDDCKAALAWMQANAAKYKIDPKRIAAYGYSAGGQLACLLGVRGSGNAEARIQCVIAGGAPCEFRSLPKNQSVLAYWLGGSRAEKPENYRLASPTSFATSDDPPVFFFHGEKDKIVPRISPQTLETALKLEDVQTSFFVVPEKGHIGAFLDHRPPCEAVKFLDEVLKKR